MKRKNNRKKRKVFILAAIMVFVASFTGAPREVDAASSSDAYLFSIKDKTGVSSNTLGAMWNGDLNKVRLEIEETRGTFMYPSKTDGNTNRILETVEMGYILDSEGDLITFYEYDSSKPYQITLNACQKESRYKGGTVHIKVFYDGEYVATVAEEIEANSDAVNALTLAKKILGSGSNSFRSDAEIIKTTIKKNYKQTDMPCGRGATVLQTWCAYKYQVYGSVNDAMGASAHVEFYPDPTKISGGPFGADGDASVTADGWPVW